MWLPQGGALKIENLTVFAVQYYNATLLNRRDRAFHSYPSFARSSTCTCGRRCRSIEFSLIVLLSLFSCSVALCNLRITDWLICERHCDFSVSL